LRVLNQRSWLSSIDRYATPANKNAIDFRSDTVTVPTELMRDAMAQCAVGDDVMGEDPTVNKLEAMAADMFAKEAAVFVPTGTMGNLLAIMTHCSGRSNELIVGDQQHIFLWEQGGSAALAGVHARTLPNQPDGTLDLKQIESAIRSVDSHYPRTKVVCLENTHNRTGGRVLTLDYVSAVKKICDKHNLKLHVDGARIWNAAVALKKNLKDLVQDVDSISVCLSKGIGAPAGTLLIGTSEFVEEARYLRKGLGGGMRQAGVLAACGIVGLETVFPKMHEDHRRAREFAEALHSSIDEPSIINLNVIETNMFVFTIPASWKITAREFSSKLRSAGVLANPTSSETLRFVLHHQITDEMVQEAVKRVNNVVHDLRK
jgi:threonine aldolase